MADLHVVSIALDWLPNATHAALYLAAERGFFAARGLAVRFLPPDALNAPATPAAGLVSGACDFGVVPCDDVLARACAAAAAGGGGPRPPVVAIATLLCADVSAVAVRADSPVARPLDLDGRTLASCGYPLELAAVRALVRADGGAGAVSAVCPPARSTTDALVLGKRADCAWSYVTWEVVRANRAAAARGDAQPALRTFRLTPAVPFAYMGTICVAGAALGDAGARARAAALLAAAAEGAAAAAADPAAAALALARASGGHPEAADVALNEAAVREMHALGALMPRARAGGGFEGYGGGAWGEMNAAVWRRFVAWARSEGVGAGEGTGGGGDDGRDEELAATLWTNELLPSSSR